MSSLRSHTGAQVLSYSSAGTAARWLFGLAIACAAIAIAAFWTGFMASDSVVDGAMRFVTPRELSPAHRATIDRALFYLASLAAFAGALFAALARSDAFRGRADAWIDWDALQVNLLRTPSAYPLMVLSTASALVVMGAWTQQYRLGHFVQWLFQKEGPFEVVTFALDILAAVLCVLAAIRWKVRRPYSIHIVKFLFAALAALLFLVAMEEINWGQTLLGFTTPEAWSRINYQHETSIHNLLDKEALTRTWKVVAIAFGLGVIGVTALSVRFRRSLLAVIDPPPALLPLALCASYAGARLHPELIELLLSFFFACYGYRAWTAARSTSHEFPSG